MSFAGRVKAYSVTNFITVIRTVMEPALRHPTEGAENGLRARQQNPCMRDIRIFIFGEIPDLQNHLLTHVRCTGDRDGGGLCRFTWIFN